MRFCNHLSRLFRDHGFHGLEKLAEIDGLGHDRFHPTTQVFFGLFLHYGSRHGHDRHMAARAAFNRTNTLGGFKSSHYRHLDVHKDDIEFSQPEYLNGFNTVPGHRNLVALLLQANSSQIGIRLDVFNQQYPETTPYARRNCFSRNDEHIVGFRDLICGRQANCEMEGTSLAFFAFDPDPAAHELDQLPGDCRAKSGTAISSCC